MDIKSELLSSVPTAPAKRLFISMMVLVPFFIWGVDQLNPLWPSLSAKHLVIAKIAGALVIVCITSILLNLYYIYKLKKLGRFISDRVPDLIERCADEQIAHYKSKNPLWGDIGSVDK
ncbi:MULTISPECIES: hypothetical protein [Vibrio]|uniref:hypothetical protein n=1 Tax=Vibrio TaxID=662 RepID=UPI001A2B2C75|nr:MULTISPECIES: hypothetical protein [Vibrio]EGQ7764746.1 hypothetical protein [Vibrio alginolyticus]MBS9830348.1 hypothetical protein [Vibrio alginolyticus]MBY7698620.1 hypothetical protein [Vibrio alginolyticus]MDW1522682.1 hypothetical protein [Vibrio sp. Vb5032]MDW2003642.1 hypothetical protein [Vibrio sp. 2304]